MNGEGTLRRAVGSGAAGAAWAAPLFWPLANSLWLRTRCGLASTGYDAYVAALYRQCWTTVFVQWNPQPIGPWVYADEIGHAPFSLCARGPTLAGHSTRYSAHYRRLIERLIFQPPHPPCPSYGPVAHALINSDHTLSNVALILEGRVICCGEVNKKTPVMHPPALRPRQSRMRRYFVVLFYPAKTILSNTANKGLPLNALLRYLSHRLL